MESKVTERFIRCWSWHSEVLLHNETVRFTPIVKGTTARDRF